LILTADAADGPDERRMDAGGDAAISWDEGQPQVM